tara:strand:+ start:3333 stop:4340 length:1008 start_codon:yes stop_codon:yes gene_type:complete
MHRILCVCLICIGTVSVLAENKPRVFFGMFGVAARSLKWTWPVIKQRMIDPIEKAGYIVDIVVMNNDTQHDLVDGHKLNQKDLARIPGRIISTRQKDIDQAITTDCREHQQCSRWIYHGKIQQNAYRQMWMENRLGAYLAKHASKYQLACVIGPDFYPLVSLSPEVLPTLVQAEKIVAGFSQSDTDLFGKKGYSNGFYLGRPDRVASILKRYDAIMQKKIPRDALDNYETLVYKAFEHANLERLALPMHFCKMRASGQCQWQANIRHCDWLRAGRFTQDSSWQLLGNGVSENVNKKELFSSWKALDKEGRWQVQISGENTLIQRLCNGVLSLTGF